MNTSSLSQPLTLPKPVFGPIILLLLLYLPSYWQYAQSLWLSPEQAHAPLILLFIAAWFYQQRHALQQLPNTRSYFAWPILLLGSLLFLLGTALRFPSLIMASQIPMLMGLLLALKGRSAIKHCAFILFLLLLTIPLPALISSGLTLPLKTGLSDLACQLLYALGYPIAQSGVFIQIGPYQMLLEDACAGLHSLYALLALGGWYAYRQQSLVPLLLAFAIALLVNLIRILCLLLFTYHLGDNFTRYWHEIIGLGCFAFAWLCLVSITANKGHTASITPQQTKHHRPLSSRYLNTLLFSTILSAWIINQHQPAPSTTPDFKTLIPASLQDWQQIQQQDLAHSQQRIYQNSQGQQILLQLAWGAQQLGEQQQIHRPEYCYQAQGFQLGNSQDYTLPLNPRPLHLRQFYAQRAGQAEYVSYWLTIGQQATLPGYQRKFIQLQQLLDGKTLDGLLIRISSRQNQALNQIFIQDLFASINTQQSQQLGLL